MSEENKNDIIPAGLAENEAEIVEELEAAVEELSEAVKEEEIAAIAVVEAETKVKDIAAELNFKPQISVVEEKVNEKVISSASQNKAKPADFAAGLTGVAGGVIGTGAVKRKLAPKKTSKEDYDKVALHSTRNVSWVGVGKVLKGINIVTADQAEKWLTRDHITQVKPEEVAQEFGK